LWFGFCGESIIKKVIAFLHEALYDDKMEIVSVEIIVFMGEKVSHEELSPKIMSRDWGHYDSYHLVWNHPYLTPAEARDILYYALKRINRPSVYLRKILPYVI
jgi:hypothetical protein